MQCLQCQFENRQGVRFCEKCGAKLELTCPSCGALVPPDRNFCGECGASLLPVVTAQEVTPDTALLEREAERRQLTVMFCDLVGSTALSTKLDPEDLREVITSFQDTCREAIQRYAGFIARYMGDGMLVYYGYPQAHEDDAERAVRAGLDIVRSMADLNAEIGKRHEVVLAVRVGVATGSVVVGDIVGEGAAEEAAVVGETPNLAARLQGVAEPNQVVVASATQRLLGALFEYEDLGAHELKGIEQPVQVWRVVRESDIDSRYEAKRVGGRLPLVGRQEELGLLVRAWEAAKERHGQVVLIQGEAGIGKSRLLAALREHVAGETYMWVANRCSPYHANSTLYPVIENIKAVMGWKREDSAEAKLEKLEALLTKQTLPPEEAVPLYAELMSLPLPEGRYVPLELSAKQKREQTLDALAGWLLEEAEQRPVLQVWEDLHWADPTTLELLGLYIEQSPTVSMLNVLAYRPEFGPPWSMHSHMTPITLNRLERPEVEALIGYQAGNKTVPSEVVEHVVAKADGVPLYVEELTKTILESDYLYEEADRYTLAGSLSELSIPATLQDSLMARLDRLPTLREVAQWGAVLGREFTYEMLQCLAPLEEPQLKSGLGQLVKNELLYQRGRPPRSRYIFKHALIQDAAYQSLLKRTRQQYHQRTARALEEQFPETAKTEPELLAHHYTEAQLSEKAIGYWQRAGQRANERLASLEAVAHLTKGLQLITSLPDTPERAKQELGLQITLAPALLSIKGWGAREVEQAYLRAQALCRRVGEHSELFTVTWGMWHHYEHCGQLKIARDLAKEVLSLAEEQSDSGRRLQAHHAAWTTYLARGEFLSCREHAEKGIALYKPDEHRAHAFVYGGHDPGVCCRVHAAMALWYLGYADQALEKAQDAATLAEELAHPYSLAQTFNYSTYLHQCRREARLVQERAEATIGLCEEQVIAPQYAAMGHAFRGWAVAAGGQANEAIAEMRQGLAALRARGIGARRPYLLTLLADACRRARRVDEGLNALAEALHLVEETGERTWEAEMYRIKGELLLSRSKENELEAKASFNKALEVARRQQAKSLELRAATSLSRLWRDEGRCQEVRDLLAPIYDWFAEGFDTADLKEAKALLADLG
jgi:class 3 adenylate cyclase/predicted ATPase